MKTVKRFQNKFGMAGTIAVCAAFAIAFTFAACNNVSDDGGSNAETAVTNPDGTTTTDPTAPANPSDPAATYIGTKAPSEAKAVGDIMFSDGSATPYSEGLTLTDAQKNAAIAVIFYVGTELNSDIFTVDENYNMTVSASDTATSRTLGVGLVHSESGLAWCTSTANAHDRNIDFIQCISSGRGKNATFTGDKDGSDNLAQISAFLQHNILNDDTATAANYPAFYFAKNYASQEGSHLMGTDYKSDWYLPTIAELFQIWKSKTTVDAASTLCGGSQFGTGSYLSSSQHVSLDNLAYFFHFGYGQWDGYAKDNTGICVCAVRAFN